MYYIEFQLAENSNLEEQKKKKFSKSDTLEEIQTVMKELFGIPALEETRLWNKYTSNTYEQLARLDNTVQVGKLPFVSRSNSGRIKNLSLFSTSSWSMLRIFENTGCWSVLWAAASKLDTPGFNNISS